MKVIFLASILDQLPIEEMIASKSKKLKMIVLISNALPKELKLIHSIVGYKIQRDRELKLSHNKKT